MAKRRRSDPLFIIEKEAKAIHSHALLPEEKEWCQNVVVFGPGWLRQKGWSSDAIKKFLGRAEVQREINMLARSYEDRVGIQERTQFFAQLKINGMVPAAINVLARALAGERRREDTGEVIPPPTRQQFEAAIEVLNRANIQGTKFGGHDQLPSIDARSINIALGTNENMKNIDAHGREKVLRVLTGFLNKSKALAAAQDIAKTQQSSPVQTPQEVSFQRVKEDIQREGERDNESS